MYNKFSNQNINSGMLISQIGMHIEFLVCDYPRYLSEWLLLRIIVKDIARWVWVWMDLVFLVS